MENIYNTMWQTYSGQ